jgi:hypothetical protein
MTFTLIVDVGDDSEAFHYSTYLEDVLERRLYDRSGKLIKSIEKEKRGNSYYVFKVRFNYNTTHTDDLCQDIIEQGGFIDYTYTHGLKEMAGVKFEFTWKIALL